jgi:hypothetical protein
MRSLLTRSLACGSLLLMALGAYAQDYPRYRNDDRYSDRDAPGYYSRQGYRGHLMDKVQADLRYAQNAAYSRDEARRLDKAREELWEFQRKWTAGRFDRHELDDSIAAIQRAVDHNGLDERARSMLWSDLRELRDFRAQYHPR